MADQTVTISIQAVIDSLQGAMAKASASVRSFVSDAKSTLPHFGTSFHEVIHRAKEDSNELGESLHKTSELFRHTLELLGAYEGYQWSKELIGGSLEAGEQQLKNMSTEIGVSVGHLQELQFAAAAAGVDFQRLTQFSAQISRAMIEIQSGEGTRMMGVLGAAGLKPSDLNDTYTAIVKIGDAINRLGEGSPAARALLTELGGTRMGMSLEPMLAKLREFTAEARNMGLILSDQMVENLDQTQEKFNILGFAMHQDRAIITNALIPVLTDLANVLTEAALKVNKLAQNGDLQRWAEECEAAIAGLVEEIATLVAFVAEHHNLIGTMLAVGGFETLRTGNVVEGAAMMAAGWEMTGNAAAAAAPKIQAAAEAVAKSSEAIRQSALDQALGLHTQIVGPNGEPAAPATGALNLTPPPTPQEMVGEIAARSKGQESVLAITEAHQKQKLAFGQETASQEIAQERSLAERKYQIQLAALQKERAVAGLKPAEVAKINAQIVELENAHTTQMIGLATKLTQTQNREQDQQLQNAIKAQDRQLAAARATVDLEKTLHQVTAAQAAQITSAMTAQNLREQLREVQALQQNQTLSLEERQKYAQQVADIDQKLKMLAISTAKAEAEAQQKAAQESLKAWSEGAQQIGQGLAGIINDYISKARTGQERWHQWMNQQWAKMLDEMLKTLLSSGIMSFLTGGAKGGIFEPLFGTQGGGVNAPGGGGMAGVLGLGGGLVGLIEKWLPSGPGGLVARLFGQATGASGPGASLQVAGVSLQTAATALQAAAATLQGAPAGGIFPAGTVPNTLGANSTTIVGGATGTGAPAAPATAGGFTSWVSQAFDSARSAIQEVFGGAFRGIQSIVQDVFGGAFQGLQSLLSSIFGALFGGSSGSSGGFMSMFSNLFGGSGGAMSSIMGMLGGGGSGGGFMSMLSGLFGGSGGAGGLSSIMGMFGGSGGMSGIMSLFGGGMFGGAGGIGSLFSILGGAGGAGGMASIFSSLSSLLPLLAFEHGGIVPSAARGMVAATGGGGRPAILHPREMVLPASLSEGVQRMVASGPAAERGSGGGGVPGASGDQHFHMHYSATVNALDQRGVSDILKQHASAISRMVVDHMTRKGGRYPAFGGGFV